MRPHFYRAAESLAADPMRRGPKRRLVAAMALTAVFLVVEVAGGLLSGSLALLSDAGHMLTDLLALALSLMAVKLACLPATPAKSYGYHRLEILSALFNGALLILISAVILFKAFVRLHHPVPVHALLMSGTALAGLLGNVAGVALLSAPGASLNLRGARLHLISDTLSSLGVLITGVVIALTGWQALDAIVGAGIALVIVAGAVRLVREAVDVLLEATPHGLDLGHVGEAIAAVPGVIEVHDLHVWSITTGLPALSGHVRVRPVAGSSADAVLDAIKRTLRDRFAIVHTTIQVETPEYQEFGDVH